MKACIKNDLRKKLEIEILLFEEYL